MPADAAAEQKAEPIEGAKKPEPENPNEVGKVDAFVGTLTVSRGGAAMETRSGLPLEKGDKVVTGDDGKVRIKLKGDVTVALGAKSTMTIADYSIADGMRKGQFTIEAGKFWANLVAWADVEKSTVEFHTPNAVAGVRGTTLWGDVALDAICSLDGTVQVRSLKPAAAKGKKTKKKKKAKKGKEEAEDPAKGRTLKAGECASKMSKGKLAPLRPTPAQVKKYLAEVMIDDGAGGGDAKEEPSSPPSDASDDAADDAESDVEE